MEITYIPLEDGGWNYGTGSNHTVPIDVEASWAVAVDHGPTILLLLHDRDPGPLVELIIRRPKPVASD